MRLTKAGEAGADVDAALDRSAAFDLEAALQALAAARTVAFGGVGFANTVSAATQAYFALRDTAATHRERIEQLLGVASPAGKVYAATLLAAIDPQAGRQAWQQLTGQPGIIQTASGCVVSEQRMASYAEARLRELGEETQEVAASGHPPADSDQARRAVKEALLGRPRVVVMTARDETHFVEALFGAAAKGTRVYVSRQVPDEFDRGPHFDLYHSVVDPAYPFVATFVVSGTATVDSTELDPELAAYYFKHYPTRTESASTAMGLVSALALQQPRWRTESQRVSKGMGMLVPQRMGTYPVVHEVRPPDSDGAASGGEFLKFLVPKIDQVALDAAMARGFRLWRSNPSVDNGTQAVARRQARLQAPE